MLSLRIALRYLFARKSHNAVNIISLVSMAGVAVAALAMICVLSVFNGFSDIAASRLSMIDPQIKVTRADGKVIEDADSVISIVKAVKGVAEALPSITGQALAIYEDAQLPVMVTGVPGDYSKVSDLTSTIIDGEMRQADEYGRYATLSVGVALSLGARPSFDNVIRIMAPRRSGRINPALPLSSFVADTLIVSSVYQSEQAEYDVDRIVIPIEDARRLFEYTSEASSIDIAMAEDANPKGVLSDISLALGNNYIVADRFQQQETAFRMITIEKWVTFLMLTFILIMASFNILSTMSMLIIEKRHSISILSSLGADDSVIRRIFLNQGFLISVVGGIGGLIVGIILVVLQATFHIIGLGGDPSQMSIDSYPVRLAAGDIAIVAAIVVVIGLISGIISASRINTSPVPSA
ncbi:MAG: FtsX-like permease family protein [Lachnoclostridium sp.]|nr:FtsX-like permease family protein [Lachnoclostridium sp.]